MRGRLRAICEAARVELRLHIEPSTEKLAGEAAHHISNLATEAVSNAIRHGRPKVITVELCFSPLLLRVSDDGEGFDSKTMDARRLA